MGENPKQADTLGVNVNRIRYMSVIIGGAFAGLGGSYIALVTTGSFSEGHCCGTRMDCSCSCNLRQMETFLDSNRGSRLRNGQCNCIRATVDRNDYSFSVIAHATVLTTNRHPGSYV